MSKLEEKVKYEISEVIAEYQDYGVNIKREGIVGIVLPRDNKTLVNKIMKVLRDNNLFLQSEKSHTNLETTLANSVEMLSATVCRLTVGDVK